MKIKELGEVIALRRFSSDIPSAAEITVLIGKPGRFPNSTDYFTPYQIVGVGGEKIKYAAGIDAIQALQLAMKMIGYDIRALNESSEHKIHWEG